MTDSVPEAAGSSRTAALLLARPGWVVLLGVVLAVAGGLLASSRLQLDADTNHLIAADRPFMADFQAWLDEFGDLESAWVVVDGHDDPAAADRAVEAVVNRLADHDDLPAVHGWISPPDQWRSATWAMPETDLAGLVDARQGLAMLAGPAPTEALLAFGTGSIDRLLDPGDPDLDEPSRRRLGADALVVLGALAAAATAWDESLTGDPVGLGEERPRQMLVNPGGRLRFIEILPRKDFGSLAAIKGPLAAIRDAVEQVRIEHPGVEIGVTGKPVLQADELATSDRDMSRAAAGALVVIALLFVRVFRGWRRPLLMVLAFAMAFGWTCGAATILVGRLNLLSIVFMLVLVGVGLDYGVHVTMRWIEARRRGLSIPDALSETLHTAGRGNGFGAVTSAGVFLLALGTDFGGLRELGLIAGVGLLCCLFAMNVVLPALLVIDDRHRPPEPRAAVPTTGSAACLQRGRRTDWIVVLGVTGVTIALGLVVATRTRFENNLLELQAEGLESVAWEHRVLADSTSASWFAASVVDSFEEIERVVAATRSEPSIGHVRSVLDLVPPPTPERARLQAALAEAAIPLGPRSVAEVPALDSTSLRSASIASDRLAGLARAVDPEAGRNLQTVSDRLGVLAKAARSDLQGVRTAVDRARSRARIAAQAVRDGAKRTLRDALPPAVRRRSISPNGRYLVSLVPAEDVWSPDPMARFVEAVRRVDPRVTGVPITQYESLRDMQRSFREMAWGAVVLVAFLVWLDFRSAKRTLIAILVLGTGLLWTLGIGTLLGVPLNVANFFAIPILVGLGIDSIIHLLHRADEGPLDDPSRGRTRRAILLTGTTTGIGFGSLVLAAHRGLQSLGAVMAIGSMACMFTTLVLLPSLLRLLHRPGISGRTDGPAAEKTPPHGNSSPNA